MWRRRFRFRGCRCVFRIGFRISGRVLVVARSRLVVGGVGYLVLGFRRSCFGVRRVGFGAGRSRVYFGIVAWCCSFLRYRLLRSRVVGLVIGFRCYWVVVVVAGLGFVRGLGGG